MTKFLQSAWTKAKQKKVQGPKPKNDKIAGTNDLFNIYIDTHTYTLPHPWVK